MSPAKGLPTTWSKDQNILWKADLPKAFNPYSSPIVSGDKVFVTTALNEATGHKLLCFNLTDGTKVWETDIPAGPFVLTDKRPGYLCPTPCTDGERVYVTFGSCELTAVDFQGKVLWQKPIEKDFGVCLATSPILYKDLVIQVCDTSMKTPSSIMAFDRKTGEVKYREARTVDTSWSTPILVTFKDKTVMIHKGGGGLQGFDPESGKTLWTANLKHGAMASPVYGGGLVYSAPGWGGDGVVVAVDAESVGDLSKKVPWTVPVAKGLSAFGSPIILDGVMYRYVGGGDGKKTPIEGKLSCVQMATGKVTTMLDLPGFHSWVSPVATADGLIYFASGGKSYVVKTGATPEIVATNDLGDNNPASPAVADGKLIIRGNSKLWCIGKP